MNKFRKIIIWSAFVLLFLSFSVFVVKPQVANALACDGWYGRACWHGYFSDGYVQYGDQVLPSGLWGVTDKQTFIDGMKYHLTRSSADDAALGYPAQHSHTAAAFIILTMSGYGAGTSRSVSQAQVDDWVARVNNPNVVMQIEDAVFQCGISNSFYQYAPLDDVAAGYTDAAGGCGAVNKMIDFYVNGVLVYRIRVACANPLGNPGSLPGLPVAVPPTIVTCGGMTNVTGRLEQGDDMTVTMTVSYTGGNPPPVPGYMNIAVTGVGSIGVASLSLSGNTYSLTSNTFKAPPPGKYDVTWTLQVNDTWPSPNPTCGGNINAPGETFDVYSYPYIEVNGGDTAAGASFAAPASQPCGSAPSNNNAGISTWNKNPASYAGAGGQYGVFANRFIQEFLTNKGNGNGRPYTSLSFAGININEPAGQYGGFFGKGPCVDYWSNKPASGQSLGNPSNQSLNALNGVYLRNGNLTINPSNIGDGQHITIYVDNGDVFIKGPSIKYGGNPNPSWANQAQIPSFKLVVHGRIFIDSSVDQLDGTYVAIPDAGYATSPNGLNSPSRGTIVTCSNGFSVRNPANAANIGPCNNALVVNGSFAANAVYFLRTIGSMSDGQPAEQFNYTPEVWLSTDSQASVDPAYQSIVGLPPVL